VTYVELLPAAEATPDNPAWHELRRAGVTASEIAAVLGISPWDSPVSLYWRKVHGWTVEDTEEMATGRRLEAVVADWWADTQGAHESLAVVRAGLYASIARPWQLATPDRLIHAACDCCGGAGGGCGCGSGYGTSLCADCRATGLGSPPHAVLECKWTGTWLGWGEEGTDDIPVHYRAQVLWQCDVLDVDEWHLAVLGPSGFRAYQGRRDERDIQIMRAAGADMVRRIADGDPPDVDSHPATVAALKQLHPSVEDYDVEVSVELAEGYRRARALRARIDAAVNGYEARIRAAIGSGRRAMCNGRLVASRSVYDQSGDMAELDSLDTDRPTVDRLNPGRSKSYV